MMQKSKKKTGSWEIRTAGTDASKNIVVKACRVNNLKGVDIEIPRGKFVVITGLSGSGKSSLAFDTLYAEGQRRYVESLSAYARQFLGRMPKPACDYIKGIPPSIAIEQRVSTRNPRSTVATSTEIYDYLKLLFARIGRLYSPVTGLEVKKHTPQDVAKYIAGMRQSATAYILVNFRKPAERSWQSQLDIYLQQGYNRVFVEGEAKRIEEVLITEQFDQLEDGCLLIDRLRLRQDSDEEALDEIYRRAADSAETAFFEGAGSCLVRIEKGQEITTRAFSNQFEEDGLAFREPSPEMFSFNNAYGACPKCEGFGMILGIDEDLVIPDKSLSIYASAVACWRGAASVEWQLDFEKKATKYGFPIFKPYKDLSPQELDLLWNGREGTTDATRIYGINTYFKHLESNLYKIQNRVRIAHFRGKTLCSECKGKRLRPDALCVKINGADISEVVSMSVKKAIAFFDHVKLNEADKKIAERLLNEIRKRLKVLQDVGLEYLTLDRASNTLSGGESQRIALTKQLGSSLVGSLYVLDEPSIGLHQRDTARLISVLKQLQELGNTVVVVEHDEEMMRAADYIIDIGPEAGQNGGEIVYAGPVKAITATTPGYTAAFLSGREQFDIPKTVRRPVDYLSVKGAYKHNLKDIDVNFPLHTLATIVGVSGSGKSTLVKDVLVASYEATLNSGEYTAVGCRSFGGDYKQIQHIEYVDQNILSRSSRSNPATYIGFYDDIRAIFAAEPLAKQMNILPKDFSFNTEGGRCEVCKGDGYVPVEMQFMADLKLPCEECGGKRFQKQILEVYHSGKNIDDILNMTVDEAYDFFAKDPNATAKNVKVVNGLAVLQSVGLGYVHLGQSSSSLSGGENQRLKLATYLSSGKTTQKPTLFVFDEPTTGLHFHDIKVLLKAFNALVDNGHSLLVIEHNPDFISASDYIIELGPEGGDDGGKLLFAGSRIDYFEQARKQ